MRDRAAEFAESASTHDGDGHRAVPDRGQDPSSEGLCQLFHAIRQRRWVLLATITLIELATWLTLARMTPVYTASGELVYRLDEYKVRELQSILHADPISEAVMATQAELLTSLHIAQKVAERGHLFDDPAFNPTKRPPSPLYRMLIRMRELLGMETEESPPEQEGVEPDLGRNSTLQAVKAALHAGAVRGSHALEVSFTAPDPLVAATAVNNAMDAYIKEQYAAKHRAVDNATGLLKGQAAGLREQVRRDEEKMSAYRAEHSLSQGVHAGTDTEEITHLTEDLAKARAELAAANARLDVARGRAGAEAQAAISPSVAQIRSQLGAVSAAMQAQAARLGAAHPEAQSLAREYTEAQRGLAAEIARVVAAMEAEQHAAAERVTALEGMLKQSETAAEEANRAQIPLNAMQRDLDAARAQLQAVLERIEQTTQQAFVESSEGHEISLAMPPERPSAPRTMQTMAASLAASVFLGLLLVHGLRMADPTLGSGDELRRLTGLPCLALIPRVGKRALGHLRIQDYVISRPHSMFAEQVRWLRAGLSLNPGQPRIIALTAATPAEGTSLLTLALGRSAQTGDNKVLMVECAVRQPSFQSLMAIDAKPGLMEVLRGETEWRQAVQQDPRTGMDVIAAGKATGDVLGLFGSQQMRRFLQESRDHYALVLLDTPPVETSSEAHIVARLADATLLCVGWRRTSGKTVAHSLTVLREARATIIGTVLTHVDRRAHLRSGYADAAVYERRRASRFRG